MGEIGYNEQEFLHNLRHWQIASIIRGYRRRDRTSWLQTRWQTWCILSSLGSKIDSPEDLLPLPFDHQKTKAEQEADDQALQELIAQCQQENEKTSIQQRVAEQNNNSIQQRVAEQNQKENGNNR